MYLKFLKRNSQVGWWAWLIFALFFGKKVNLDLLVHWPRENNFLDVIVSVSDIVVAGYALFGYVQIMLKKPQLTLFFSGLVLFINLFWYQNGSQELNQGWAIQNIFYLCRLFLWFWVIQKVYKNEQIFGNFRFLIIGIFGLYGLFEHALLSQSFPILILVIWLEVVVKKSIVCGFSLGLWHCLNFIISLFQNLSGKNAGLHWLGEPPINIMLTGIAKQEFGHIDILRGYGLTQHPNILGFACGVGVVFCFIILNNSQFLNNGSIQVSKQGFGRPARIVPLLIGIMIITALSTFSRLTLISLLVVFVFWIGSRVQKFHAREWFLLTLSLFVVTIIFSTRIVTDTYRLIDLQNWFLAYSQLPLIQKLFGIGLGSYPYYLNNWYPEYPFWQWQPVHNLYLGLIVELGLVPIISGMILVSQKWISKGLHL